MLLAVANTKEEYKPWLTEKVVLLLVLEKRRTDWLDEEGRRSQRGNMYILSGGVPFLLIL